MEKQLKEKVVRTIKKFNLIEDGDRLVLGVSGGPDSICMLDILIDIQKELNVSPTAKNCHFNTSPMAILVVKSFF